LLFRRDDVEKMSARRLLSTISASFSRRTGPSLLSRTPSHPVPAPKDQQQNNAKNDSCKEHIRRRASGTRTHTEAGRTDRETTAILQAPYYPLRE